MKSGPGDCLAADRTRIEFELKRVLGSAESGAVSGKVREAMRYAVLGAGQRIRPVLALRIARTLGTESDLVVRAAAAVELIHCASLVVDDLPCMDDEKLRRGVPATHLAFGESTALLASFGLVALAARTVVEQRCSPTQLSSLIDFQIHLLRVLDAGSLIEGQDLDLRLAGELKERHRDHVRELKTVPLFELSARAGLLFTDPDSTAARTLRRFSRQFGMAFQVVDDFLDNEAAGREEVAGQLDACRKLLRPIEPATAALTNLLDYLHGRCANHARPSHLGHR